MSANESNWPSWVRKAEHDLLNIRNNLAAEQVPWDTVCFHAQQVAEKMLKAFQAFQGQQPPRTHDLVALLAECLEIDAQLRDLAAACELLTPYAVEVRYPMGIHETQESEARAVVEAAQQVRAAILQRLPPLPSAGHNE